MHNRRCANSEDKLFLPICFQIDSARSHVLPLLACLFVCRLHFVCSFACCMDAYLIACCFLACLFACGMLVLLPAACLLVCLPAKGGTASQLLPVASDLRCPACSIHVYRSLQGLGLWRPRYAKIQLAQDLRCPTMAAWLPAAAAMVG